MTDVTQSVRRMFNTIPMAEPHTQIPIQLSRVESSLCAMVAKSRQKINTMQGRVDRKNMSMPGAYVHFVGMAGEVAIAKWLDIPMRTEIWRTGGYDLAYRGLRIQAKSLRRTYPATALRNKADATIVSHVFILASYDKTSLDVVRIEGWLPVSEYFELAYRESKYGKDWLVVPNNRLYAPQTFKDLTEHDRQTIQVNRIR